MKKSIKNFLKCTALTLTAALSLNFFISCASDDDSSTSNPDSQIQNGDEEESPKSELSAEDALIVNQFANVTRPTSTPKNDNPTIYCAGDSTVKTYPESQFIGGWGQFLQLFLDETKVTVKNAANGGRSSRSFINEGRLYDKSGTAGYSYSFSENNRKAIGADGEIKKGDFLLIQFGHNDDDSAMAKNANSYYKYAYNRLVPLGTPDANGIYPVTAPTKLSETTTLPAIYTQYATDTEKTDALAEIAKYGTKYYAYDCGGTYKWFLKQYILFARSKGAIPVLVTPVPRQSFNSDGTLKSGPGLHGEDFAYVKAVRQLAQEEDCLLIDLFAEIKTIQETLYVVGDTTNGENSYATFLHAFASTSGSSDLACTAEGITDYNSQWITEYDAAYKNTSAGYNRLDTTHYNKFGAFLQAAKIAEAILKSTKTEADVEYFYFKENVKTTPTSYVSAPNRISKAKVDEVAALFTNGISVKNPNQVYPQASEVVSLITSELGASVATITKENLSDYKTKVATCRAKYNALNFDDRSGVTNYNILTGYETAIADYIEANRPKPTEIYFYNFNGVTENISSSTTLTVPDSTMTVDGLTPKGGEITLVGKDSSSALVSVGQKADFTYNNTKYEVTNYLQAGLWTAPRYIEFPVSKPNARVTIVAKSGSASQNRTVNMSKDNFTTLHALEVTGTEINLKSVDITETGTYRIGSAGSNIYFYAIIVEYYPTEE